MNLIVSRCFLVTFILLVLSQMGCSTSTRNGEEPEADGQPDMVDTDDPSSDGLMTGRFVFGGVGGLSFATPSESGVTDAAGRFSYRSGETITFSLGDLNLPAIAAKALISPQDIFTTSSVYDSEVVNFARLLLSLDSDGDSNNGVSLSEQTSALVSSDLSFGARRFDTLVSTLIANSEQMRGSLVTGEVALTQLREDMENAGLPHDGCGSEHAEVGKSAEFTTLFHDVSGTLKVIDDCTLEITQFNYDGQGPLVYFYAAVEQQYSSQQAFVIGPLLTGTEYRDDQVLLKLPADKTLDDVNSLSVWCIDFAVNFGDAYLGDM